MWKLGCKVVFKTRYNNFYLQSGVVQGLCEVTYGSLMAVLKGRSRPTCHPLHRISDLKFIILNVHGGVEPANGQYSDA